MPVTRCSVNGRPGLKWGDSGKCYTYDPKVKGSKGRAYRKVMAQKSAIEHRTGQSEKSS